MIFCHYQNFILRLNNKTVWHDFWSFQSLIMIAKNSSFDVEGFLGPPFCICLLKKFIFIYLHKNYPQKNRRVFISEEFFLYMRSNYYR